MFIPQAMVDVSNAVKPVATAMAAACFSCAMCLGQLISPTVLNGISKLIFGSVSTTHVFLVATVGMFAAALCAFLFIAKQKEL
jgi:hypothetical protein